MVKRSGYKHKLSRLIKNLSLRARSRFQIFYHRESFILPYDMTEPQNYLKNYREIPEEEKQGLSSHLTVLSLLDYL